MGLFLVRVGSAQITTYQGLLSPLFKVTRAVLTPCGIHHQTLPNNLIHKNFTRDNFTI